ncbi:hypothetical protein M8J77_018411 [Diaphorina citri]|nr:hypothetical protein M8J77_018411 [Diaphorina citri]
MCSFMSTVKAGYSDPYCLLGLIRSDWFRTSVDPTTTLPDDNTVLSPVAVMAGIIGDVSFVAVSLLAP